MEKYVTNIKDLVIQVLANGSEIKSKAEKGDALSCFQMGMIHLLGINTTINFKKASNYLGNQSLSDDPDAHRLLGFIAECEGDYSSAFEHYAHASSSTINDDNSPIYYKIYEERKSLHLFLEKIGLPTKFLNKEITAILDNYEKGGKYKDDACVKMAILCDDESSSLEAARICYENKDYISAKRWLRKGNIAKSNPLYVSIEKKKSTSKKKLKFSDSFQIIELKGKSLLDGSKTISIIEEVKNKCDDISASCRKQWQEKLNKHIHEIITEWKKAEKQKKDKEKAEQTAYLKQLRKEKAEEAKRNKIIKIIIIHTVLCIVIFLIGLGVDDAGTGIAFVFIFYCLYLLKGLFF